ncbi:hypothetical protein, partial [Vibrio xiamenensis]|uniref:hypothetical protein n=1 Tax=Vibrio xiamenensis TaxID=861298 RepID=UPI001C4096D5
WCAIADGKEIEEVLAHHTKLINLIHSTQATQLKSFNTKKISASHAINNFHFIKSLPILRARLVYGLSRFNCLNDR